MEIQAARYADPAQGFIAATVDGAASSIPVDPGNRIYQEIIEQNISVGPYVGPSQAELRAGISLTDIQFAIASTAAGLMTGQEAEDWVGSGALPAATAAALLAIPEEFRAAARIRFRGARTIERLDPFIAVIQASLSLTDAQVDAIFVAGASL